METIESSASGVNLQAPPFVPAPLVAPAPPVAPAPEMGSKRRFYHAAEMERVANLASVDLPKEPATPAASTASILCVKCGSSFEDNRKFQLHDRRHRGVLPMHCDFCQRAFRSLDMLLSHEESHKGEGRCKNGAEDDENARNSDEVEGGKEQVAHMKDQTACAIDEAARVKEIAARKRAKAARRNERAALEKEIDKQARTERITAHIQATVARRKESAALKEDNVARARNDEVSHAMDEAARADVISAYKEAETEGQKERAALKEEAAPVMDEAARAENLAAQIQAMNVRRRERAALKKAIPRRHMCQGVTAEESRGKGQQKAGKIDKLRESRQPFKYDMLAEKILNAALADGPPMASKDIFFVAQLLKTLLRDARVRTVKSRLKVHQNLGLPCSVCQKPCRTKIELRFHEQTHIEGKSFACRFCGLKHQTERTLKRHERAHVKGRTKSFVCDQCGKGCVDNYALRTHY